MHCKRAFDIRCLGFSCNKIEFMNIQRKPETYKVSFKVIEIRMIIFYL